jgi:hypothetical protein
MAGEVDGDAAEVKCFGGSAEGYPVGAVVEAEGCFGLGKPCGDVLWDDNDNENARDEGIEGSEFIVVLSAERIAKEFFVQDVGRGAFDLEVEAGVSNDEVGSLGVGSWAEDGEIYTSLVKLAGGWLHRTTCDSGDGMDVGVAEVFFLVVGLQGVYG